MDKGDRGQMRGQVGGQGDKGTGGETGVGDILSSVPSLCPPPPPSLECFPEGGGVDATPLLPFNVHKHIC